MKFKQMKDDCPQILGIIVKKHHNYSCMFANVTVKLIFGASSEFIIAKYHLCFLWVSIPCSIKIRCSKVFKISLIYSFTAFRLPGKL